MKFSSHCHGNGATNAGLANARSSYQAQYGTWANGEVENCAQDTQRQSFAIYNLYLKIQLEKPRLRSHSHVMFTAF